MGQVTHKGGTLFSSDFFYHPDPDIFTLLKKHGVLGVEMEAYALYTIAKEQGCRALAVVTASDDILDGSQALTSEERQTKVDAMFQVGLRTAKYAQENLI